MFGWLKRSAQHSRIERARVDMDLYVRSLRGMTSFEVATSRVLASTVLLEIGHDGDLLKDVLDGKSFDEQLMKTLLANLEIAVRKAQKVKAFAIAAGLMLWIHSLRAVMFPPLRIDGKSVWNEMERGGADYAEAMHKLQISGLDIPNDVIWDMAYVPTLLDPRLE